jgi:hypothetical protein
VRAHERLSIAEAPGESDPGHGLESLRPEVRPQLAAHGVTEDAVEYAEFIGA